MPTLKWLCAQQVHKNHLLFKPKNQTLSDAGSIYSEKNIAGAANLIDDAKKYDEIDFAASYTGHL